MDENNVRTVGAYVTAIVVVLLLVAGAVLIARMIINAVVRVKVARYTGVDPGAKTEAGSPPESSFPPN